MSRRCAFTCMECRHDFVVIGDDELLRKCVSIHPECPTCEAPLVLGKSSSARNHSTTELDVHSFWNAINGFGLPDEVVAGAEAVEALLLAHRVTAADLINTKSGRVEVRSLTLANGVKMHFAASGEGAVIFKSTKEEADGSES